MESRAAVCGCAAVVFLESVLNQSPSHEFTPEGILVFRGYRVGRQYHSSVVVEARDVLLARVCCPPVWLELHARGFKRHSVETFGYALVLPL